MTYNDPQEVYGGECAGCHDWVTDRDEDLDANDLCDDCAEEAEDVPLFIAPPPRTDWLALAADLVTQVRL